MEINQVTRIQYATLGKRFLAFFFDVVLSLFVGLGIYAATAKIISCTSYITEMKVKFNNMVTESHVMVVNEEKSEFKNSDTYEKCVEDFYYFYNDYLPKYNVNKEPISNYWFNVFVLGLDDEKGIYSYDELSDRKGVILTGKEIFEYRVESGDKKYDLIGIPKAYNQGAKPFKDVADDDQQKILSYFYNDKDDNSKVSYFAAVEIAKLNDLNELYNESFLWETTIPLLTGLFLGYMIFFFVIPMCLKDGKTLGKKFMKVSLVSTAYYSVKKSQIILRYLPQALLFVVAMLFIGINIASISIVTLGVVASYLLAIFKSDHQSIHDMISGTYVVLDELSIWFKNEEEEQVAIQKKKEIVG